MLWCLASAASMTVEVDETEAEDESGTDLRIPFIQDQHPKYRPAHGATPRPAVRSPLVSSRVVADRYLHSHKETVEIHASRLDRRPTVQMSQARLTLQGHGTTIRMQVPRPLVGHAAHCARRSPSSLGLLKFAPRQTFRPLTGTENPDDFGIKQPIQSLF